MFSTSITKHIGSSLAIAACLIMTPAYADVIDDTRAKIYEGMLTIGQQVQLARECGLLDRQMPGYFAGYQSYLKVHEVLYNKPNLSTHHKAKLGPVSGAKEQFVRGTQQVITARHRISTEQCIQLKQQWAASDAIMAEYAKKNLELAQSLDKKQL